MADVKYHVETLLGDAPLEDLLNEINQSGGTIVSVLPVACINSVVDATGKGYYHWWKIVYTTK
jgi:hypothetical protein